MRYGVVGMGGMGTVHTSKVAARDDCELLIYDRNAEKVDEAANRFGAQVAESLEALIDAADVVDVCLPTVLHAEVTVAALRAKKPVLCEKPLARSVEECRKILKTSRESETPVMTAQVVRRFPEYERAHELIREGAVGKPAVARLRRGGRTPVGSEGWFRDLSQSGGVILDLIVHDFDWLRWTLGEVTSVYAKSIRHGEHRRPDVAGDHALVTLSHKGGCISHVEGSWMDPTGFRTSIEVCGSGGMLTHDSRTDASLVTRTSDGVRLDRPLGAADPYAAQIGAFVQAVKSGETPPVTALDGLKAVAIAEAALESARTGEPVAPESA